MAVAPVEDRGPTRAPEVAVAPWEVLEGPRREGWWVRARRVVVVVVATVVVAAGGISIASTITGWLSSPTATTVAADPAVSEPALLAAALPFAVDYLSWDSRDRPVRQTALARVAAPGVAVDGWDGSGVQLADTPVVIGVARAGIDRAVVTVRVRVTPFTEAGRPAPAGQDDPDAGPNVASGPRAGATGRALQPRWLNLAVPVQSRGGRVVVTARPALVGSAPEVAAAPALPRGTGAGDADYARDTRDTVTTLLRSYGSGDLEFVRAAGTTFEGLNTAAALDSVTEWRVVEQRDGTDGSTRVGDATVLWELSGGAGKLLCSYRIELVNDNDRWYLLSIGAELEEVS